MQTIIGLQNISKTYTIAQQKVAALRDISIDIEAGKKIAVTGKSGAGKSTLLHIIGTLERPSTGKIFLAGTDVSTMPDQMLSSFRNSSVGFIFQMNNLLAEFTALENVMMPGLIASAPKKEILYRAKELLESVGLHKRSNHRPSELSGGEQQRVAIARSLIMAPPILLADEPTGNLDQKSSEDVKRLLFELCDAYNITLLLVTHDLHLASQFPHQIIMEDGMIIERI